MQNYVHDLFNTIFSIFIYITLVISLAGTSSFSSARVHATGKNTTATMARLGKLDSLQDRKKGKGLELGRNTSPTKQKGSANNNSSSLRASRFPISVSQIFCLLVKSLKFSKFQLFR
jgi:hypothetical protein